MQEFIFKSVSTISIHFFPSLFKFGYVLFDNTNITIIRTKVTLHNKIYFYISYAEKNVICSLYVFWNFWLTWIWELNLQKKHTYPQFYIKIAVRYNKSKNMNTTI